MKSLFSKLYIVVLIFAGIIGLCICNIALNRTIYCSEIHMKSEEQKKLDRTNSYNLNEMEKILDTMDYKSEDFHVPRIRILFRLNPFDLRFETRNYKICVRA